MDSKKTRDLQVRLGTSDDYEAVLAIQRRAYQQKEVPLYGTDLPPLKETPETLEAELAEEGKQLLVGEVDGRIVTSLRMKVLEDGAAYFCRLSVDPVMQGRGLGQRMVAAFEAFYPEAKEFALDCGEKSEENMHIYSKLGYIPTGESLQVPGGPLVLMMRKRR